MTGELKAEVVGDLNDDWSSRTCNAPAPFCMTASKVTGTSPPDGVGNGRATYLARLAALLFLTTGFVWMVARRYGGQQMKASCCARHRTMLSNIDPESSRQMLPPHIQACHRFLTQR